MADPKLHIARGKIELGPFPQSEIAELLKAGFLLTTDVCWSEGQTARRPLSEILTTTKPVRASMAVRVKSTMLGAAKSVRAGAVLATGKVSSAASRKKSEMTVAANRMLEDYLPHLTGLVTGALKKSMRSAETALHDEVFLRKLFGAVYDVIPKPIRRFVDEEMFIEFCLRHKRKLLGKES